MIRSASYETPPLNGATRAASFGSRQPIARDRAAGRPGEHRDRPLTDVADPRVVRAVDSDREHARRDRVAAANDRADAALDRQTASADRTAAALDRRQACLDGLTGAFNREAGLLELGRAWLERRGRNICWW